MGAGTWESHHAITTLMFRYAEYVDAADFDAIADLFADAVITNEGVEGEIAGGEAIKQLYLNTNKVHDDGTLRTRHLTANVAVDIEESAGTATARSSFVVFQQTPTLPAAADRDRSLPRPIRPRRPGLAVRAAAHHRRPRRRRPRAPRVRPRRVPGTPPASSVRAVCAADARHLLVVYHSRSGGTQTLADAVIAGATSDEIDDVEVRVRRAFDATVDDVRWCDGILLGTPENFGYMSGALKDFFERIYYDAARGDARTPLRAVREGRPRRRGRDPQRREDRDRPALEGGAGAGARGRRRSTTPRVERCHELGITFAAGLEAGVF